MLVDYTWGPDQKQPTFNDECRQRLWIAISDILACWRKQSTEIFAADAFIFVADLNCQYVDRMLTWDTDTLKDYCLDCYCKGEFNAGNRYIHRS